MLISRSATALSTAREILSLLLPYRRGSEPTDDPAAFGPQLDQLTGFLATGDPILFTLPAFPCKSPNPAKVLGHLPDHGERLALRFLDDLCARIEEIHPAGAQVLICSDGHIFGDLIGVPDDHVDAYAAGLRAVMAQENLTRLALFTLTDVLGELPYDEKRQRVHDRYAPSAGELRARAKSDPEFLHLYLGITRFLVNDTTGFPGSRTALQRDCRRRAYGVIQRSRAWGALIAEHHPRSVRLSIHPQPAGAAKFGIRLLNAAGLWTTPWHSCAVHRTDGTWELLPRRNAEKLGRLVLRDGRPDHFEEAGAER
jgi:pyoverdine/dityrosine biosynthesis protein Dit1